MEKKGDNNYCQYLTLSDKIFERKESFLISHKSFLEMILEQIKQFQYLFISENNNHLFISENNNHYQTVKRNLITFKNSLLSTLNEKKEKQKYLEGNINIKKSKLQKELFDETINKNNRIIQFTNCNNYDDFKLNENTINYSNEKELLQKLSFKTENEINSIEFKIQKLIQLIVKLRVSRFYQEENMEISADQNKLKIKATHIMKKNLSKNQKNLLRTINEKIKNDLKANKIKEAIEYRKNEIKTKEEHEYISSEDGIFEGKNNHRRNTLLIDNPNNEKKNIKEKDIDKNKNNRSQKNKENRNSLNNINNHNIFNDNINDSNENIYLKEFEGSIKQKIIRSLSNKMTNRISLKHIKDNCKLNLNVNFNINNLNIINAGYHKDKDKKYLNLTYDNKL